LIPLKGSPPCYPFWSRNSSKRRLINDTGNDVVKGKELENKDPEIVKFFQSLQDKLRVVIEAGSNLSLYSFLPDSAI